MNTNGSSLSERMKEANSVCARLNPIYWDISNYSLALYVLGSLNAPDIMSAEDIDMDSASRLLREKFQKVTESEIPHEYNAVESKERYLMVLGNPQYPTHFAALVDRKSDAPYFSKLRHFGSGFDSLSDLHQAYNTETTSIPFETHYYRAI